VGPSSAYRSKSLLSGFGDLKAPSSIGKISSVGVLRLRAIRPVSPDKSVRRFAQDDGFFVSWRKTSQVGRANLHALFCELAKNIANKFALP
jgi:hypothetical protein